MKVAIYSNTPLAAAPWELYKALRKYTDLEVNLINGKHRYADGRIFPFHILMDGRKGPAIDALATSELWHIHNYLTQQLVELRDGQRVIAQFHSLPRMGNWSALQRFADCCYTIKQPLHEKEYITMKPLPNIIDPDEYRPMRRQRKVTIAFAPSTKLPVGNIASKGYFEVKATLRSVATKRDVEIRWIEGEPYRENLEMKRSSHILIDDVVTGNWHRTSLEGACFGCAVINKARRVPFVNASLHTLERQLLWLIDNRPVLQDYQERTRLWVLQKWHAIDTVKAYVRAYKEALR